MTSFHLTGDALWQRMERAVQKVRERLERTAAALEQVGIPYAIIGGNAVRAWVAQADEARERLLERQDELERTVIALRYEGYSNVEIAEQTGWNIRKVQRFLKDLHDSLRFDGDD